MDGVSIVIPAYNEAGGIGDVLDQIHQVIESAGLPFEVIVVDDGSTDGTAEVAKSRSVRLIRHAENRGYGASLKTGIRHAQYKTLVITDADGTYPNEEIPRLVQWIGDYDMAVGARAGEQVHVPLLRRPAKWMLNQLANYLSGTKIPDLNSGLRAMKKELVFEFFRILPDGFSFTTTITLALLTNGYQVKYVPISYFQRVGRSKIKPIRDTLNFTFLIVRTILGFNPLKVLLPLAVLLLILGIAKSVYDVVSYDWHIASSTIVIMMTAFQTLLLSMIADLIVRYRR